MAPNAPAALRQYPGGHPPFFGQTAAGSTLWSVSPPVPVIAHWSPPPTRRACAVTVANPQQVRDFTL